MLLLLQKLNISTQGYAVRTCKLWTKIDATLKQIDTYGNGA